MAFWKSGEEEKKKEEMQEVKRQVEGRETRLPEPPKPPVPEGEFVEEAPEIEEPKGVEEPELPTTRKPEPEKGGEFAPLFVKIDKYRQVLQSLEDIKNTLQDLRDLFSLMNELDGTKREGMKELREGISSLTDALIQMDEKFIRPEGAEELIEKPSTEVSGTVERLRSELKDVRRELEKV